MFSTKIQIVFLLRFCFLKHTTANLFGWHQEILTFEVAKTHSTQKGTSVLPSRSACRLLRTKDSHQNCYLLRFPNTLTHPLSICTKNHQLSRETMPDDIFQETVALEFHISRFLFCLSFRFLPVLKMCGGNFLVVKLFDRHRR